MAYRDRGGGTETGECKLHRRDRDDGDASAAQKRQEVNHKHLQTSDRKRFFLVQRSKQVPIRILRLRRRDPGSRGWKMERKGCKNGLAGGRRSDGKGDLCL